MSKSSKSSSTTNQSQNVVTTPTNPQWVTDSSRALQTRINGLLGIDPQSLVPGASPLQTQAFGAASGLLGTSPPAPTYEQWHMGGGNAGSVTPAATTSPSAGDWRTGNTTAQQAATNLLTTHIDPRQAATPTGVTTTLADVSPEVKAQLATGAPQVQAQLAAVSPQVQAMLANASPEVKAQLAAVSPQVQAILAQSAGAVAPTLASSGSLLDADLSKYQNPYLNDVVKTTLAGADEQTAMQQAALRAAQARGQKFSGSGSAIERALFTRGAAQDRAALEANLRAQGYDKATAAAMADLDRSADTSRFNAGLSTSTALSEAQRADEMARANAALGTSTALTEAQRADEMARSNAALGTSTALTEAQRADEMARANATLGTSTALTEAQRADEAARANAALATSTNLTEAQRADEMARSNAALGTSTNLTEAQRADEAARANAALATSTNLTEAQRADEMARANATLGTSTALTEAARRDAAARANATEANTNARYDAGLLSDTNQFNAGQANTMSVADRAAQLQAAGLLGDLSNVGAANSRADISLLSDLGSQQREIERQRLGADPNMLALIAALNAQQPYNLYHGGTTNSTGTTTSNSKTTESDPMGAVGGILSGVGSVASGLGAMGATLGPLAIFSDKRLKTDVRTLGRDGSGRRLVSYRYKGEPENVRRVGHIAQEVEKTDPWAVTKIGKYKAIDYGLLGEAA
jgi:hypothetical protein